MNNVQRAQSEDSALAGNGDLRRASSCDDELTTHVCLIQLKREVKQIMEEAVMKRFISEESSAVTALCCSVEKCLADGLKRRIFGIFGSTSTLALLQNVANMCPPAASVLRTLVQIEQQSFKDQKRLSFDKLNESPQCLLSKQRPPSYTRYLWIRIALFEKVLSTIVDYISKHSAKFYEKGALMADPVAGSMVAALLMGPCALEFSKAKSLDQYFTDPPADELMQRHRIHARTPSRQSFSPKTPRTTIQVRRTDSLGPDEMSKKLSTCARDYVTSMHQDTRSTLLYGKNNVQVFPTGDAKPMKGYLSLHKASNSSLIVKWMPNELVHTNSDPESDFLDKSTYWQYALCLNVWDLVYIHCHIKGNNGGNIVFIGTDGIQHPPIHLPPGQHPLAFMSCLENGLLPEGQLDPPLWVQKGKGKIFPKLRRRSSATSVNGMLANEENEENGDYVFRIVPVHCPGSSIDDDAASFVERSCGATPGVFESRFSSFNSFSTRFKQRIKSLGGSPSSTPPPTPRSIDSRNSPQCSPPSTPERDIDISKKLPHVLLTQNSAPAVFENVYQKADLSYRGVLKSACDSMKVQILSRAFHGWFAYCRNMKTIRTHLRNLVKSQMITIDHPSDASIGLNDESWRWFRSGLLNDISKEEFNRLIYFGGVQHSIRSKVWPYLFGLFPWGEDDARCSVKLARMHEKYENAMTEWLAVESIVREKDREAFKLACENRYNGKVLKSARLSDSDFGVYGDKVDYEYDTSPPLLPQSFAVSVGDDGPNERAAKTYLPNEIIMDAVPKSNCLPSDRSTPEEGDGGVYSKDLVDLFAMNLHRIEKDVHRCDRNYWYFTSNKNLDKLKNIMCTYVWENLENGYVQGMCDLAAPLLVIFDDEVLTYGCFVILMKKMVPNFPHGNGMDENLTNMRSLLQVVDPELFDLMHRNGDYTHFYFSYRWFLLDFKRELVYDDVFYVWEVIWAASHVASSHFTLFLSLALIETYRDVVIDNNMDFTDIIKFFNEMAERHDAKTFVGLARDFVFRLQQAMTP